MKTDDNAPITNPKVINGCIVFQTTWEDAKRIQAWNWKAIGLMAAELMKQREGKDA